MAKLTKVEFTRNDLSEVAFKAYSGSDITFYQDEDGVYHYSDTPRDEKFKLGTIKDVEDILLEYA